MNISKQLKTIRTKTGLTQNELCKSLKMDQRQYSKYEVGTRTPKLDILVKLANFYRLPLDLIILGDKTKLSEKLKLENHALLELFYEIARLEKKKRDRVIWTLQALLKQK